MDNASMERTIRNMKKHYFRTIEKLVLERTPSRRVELEETANKALIMWLMFTREHNTKEKGRE